MLLSDGFDVWKVPVNGGTATNLTVDGKKNGSATSASIRSSRTAPAAAGGGRGGRGGGAVHSRTASISRSRCTSARTASGRRRKVLARSIRASRARRRSCGTTRSFVPEGEGRRRLRLHEADGDRLPELLRRERRPVKQRVSGALKGGRQLTDANPQQKDFAWTSGVKLINYTSAKGDKLQGALYLPGELRAGQEVSAARHDLREALEPSEQLRVRRARRARRTAASTRAAATRCSIRTSSTRSTIPACRRCGA